MVKQSIEPVRPEDVKVHFSSASEAVVEQLIKTVNALLCAPSSIATLASGTRVEVFDSSNSADWQLYHGVVMARFEKAGWSVKSDKPGHYYVGMSHHA